MRVQSAWQRAAAPWPLPSLPTLVPRLLRGRRGGRGQRGGASSSGCLGPEELKTPDLRACRPDQWVRARGVGGACTGSRTRPCLAEVAPSGRVAKRRRRASVAWNL
eukprot:scaffold803_cov310-Pinguiococcus_pyrenoidosus.AAC.164